MYMDWARPGCLCPKTGYQIKSSAIEVIRTAWHGSEKINLLAGLLQAAGLQGEVKVAFGIKAPDNCLGLGAISQLFRTLLSEAGIHENISLSIRWMVRKRFWK